MLEKETLFTQIIVSQSESHDLTAIPGNCAPSSLITVIQCLPCLRTMKNENKTVFAFFFTTAGEFKIVFAIDLSV